MGVNGVLEFKDCISLVEAGEQVFSYTCSLLYALTRAASREDKDRFLIF